MNNKKYDGNLYPVRKVQNLRDLIFSSCNQFADEVAYLKKDKKIDKFVPITYSQVGSDVISLAYKLLELGLENKKIAVIGETSYNWILTYFATVSGVGVIVPLDKNLPEEEIINLINRSEASCLAFSGKIGRDMGKIVSQCESIEMTIRLDESSQQRTSNSRPQDEHKKEYELLYDQTPNGVSKTRELKTYEMERLITEGRGLMMTGGQERFLSRNIDPDQMVTLMFTSGTTGLAKGVMLSHKNITYNVYSMSQYVKIPEKGIVLSILPIHHAYEMTCDVWTTFYQGKTLAICEGIKYIQKNMLEVKANVMLGVPLVFEKMYKGMWKQAEKRGEGEKLRKAIDLSKKLKLYNNQKLIKKLFKPVHQNFGGAMKLLIAGGAAIDPKVIEDFEAMGIPMIQGYGMSEHAPIITVNQDRYSKAASAGKALPGTRIKIIDRDENGIGEIICKSPSVMLGYYKDPEATKKVIKDGWLYTGDLGYLDDDGFLFITGRKKNVIVTKGGKNIFPEELEALISENPHVIEVVVHGTKDDKIGNSIVTADIHPNYESLKYVINADDSSEVYHYFKEEMERINERLPQYKAIKRVNIRKEEFTKTTTGKIKRFEVDKNSSSDYKGDDTVTYKEVKASERARAKEFVKYLENSTDPYVRHKFSRPITDLKDMFESSVALYGDNVAFMQKFNKDEPYTKITYKEALADVNGLGTALINRGLKDKRIAIIGDTCYQWESSYLSVVNGVGVVVPLDKELKENEIAGLLKEAQVSAVICQSKYVEIFNNIKSAGETPLKLIISFGDKKIKDDELEKNTLKWRELIEEGKEQIAHGDRQFIDAEIIGDVMSVLLFTSGTTGVAKGVMLSHYNLAYDLMSAPTILHVNPWDIFFSVLPVHHTYECTAAFLMPLYKGAAIAYCQGLKYITKNLEEVKPTMLLGVPILIETLYKKIWKGIREKGKEGAVKKILKLNRITKKAHIDIAKPFVKDILKVFGGRMRVLISGGAAIDPEILDFFNDLGIISVQGYGLTECAPMVALNPDKRSLMRNESVGHVLPGISVRVVDANEEGIGEICFKGDNIMLGYYNNTEATEEVLRNGWFHTGDLGYVDDEDFVFITGRKKNVIITKNGKNVYPEEIEYYLSRVPYINESMVWGDNEGGTDTSIVATVTLDDERISEVLGKDFSLADAEKLIWEEIDKINEDLAFFKKVKKLRIRNHDFEKTSGKKIKRFVDENKL